VIVRIDSRIGASAFTTRVGPAVRPKALISRLRPAPARTFRRSTATAESVGASSGFGEALPTGSTGSLGMWYEVRHRLAVDGERQALACPHGGDDRVHPVAQLLDGDLARHRITVAPTVMRGS
jgi:hypothetical protein